MVMCVVKQPRSKNLSPIGKYLWNNRISDIEFAKSMKERLGAEKFSSSTVENWRYGRATPKDDRLSAVRDLTGMSVEQILGLS